MTFYGHVFYGHTVRGADFSHNELKDYQVWDTHFRDTGWDRFMFFNSDCCSEKTDPGIGLVIESLPILQR